MARQAVISVDNDFRNGLVTEATGLNFPEHACTETYNCEFNLDGSVSRRFGFDFEPQYTTKTIDRSEAVVNTYIWRNVAGDGNTTILVVQTGDTLNFYRLNDVNFSTGEVDDTITLEGVTDAPNISHVEAQFSDGNGFLFVTHPFCEPMRISYDPFTNEVEATDIILKIRDFEGASEDSLEVDERPTSTFAALADAHEYNLRNQGWTTANLTAWDTAQTTMPSNADVMWLFQDADGNFDASSAAIARVTLGNTPAPKGHFILTLSDQNRDTAGGVSGVASTTSEYNRPSTSAFFAGRLFYAGINYSGFNSNIYFTQIVERVEQYGSCYQVNDPTSEHLYDLLPSDGGVISIPEAGTIFKLITVPGGLAVFAANGVWLVTGSTGLGFTATDYTVQKISTIKTLSATSFVDVMGYPSWWNADGIHIMFAEGNFPTIKSLSDDKIKSFYDEIPLTSKKFARGIYHAVDKHIRWIYRSTGTLEIQNIYEFDRVLNFNIRTGSFSPWTISDSPVKVHAILVSDLTSGSLRADDVIDNDEDLVVDEDDNQVIAYTISGIAIPTFDKYLVSYPEDSSWEYTFADKTNADHLDWFTYDTEGTDFESYFITGFKIRGDAIRKFQVNYVNIFSRLEDDEKAYDFQGIWDYAITGDTGRWSSKQRAIHTDYTNYSTQMKRMKVRGHGKALQFKVSSVEGYPFDIVGWSALQTANQGP